MLVKMKLKIFIERISIKVHPDRNKSPGSEEKFKEISEDYAVLSDDEKRKKYDTYGHVGSEDVFRGSEANFEECLEIWVLVALQKLFSTNVWW